MGVLLWLQDNLLVRSYGLLEAEGIDLGEATWQSRLEIGLWLATLLLLLRFAPYVTTTGRLTSQALVAQAVKDEPRGGRARPATREATPP